VYIAPGRRRHTHSDTSTRAREKTKRVAGATERAIETGLTLVGLDPLQEPGHRALMRLYAQAGRRGAALRQYQACVAVPGGELGVEPLPYRLRYRLAWDHALCRAVLGVYARALLSF